MSKVDKATDENITWVETVPTLTHFAQVGDASLYVPLPDDWYLGLSDVLDSTESIASGDYKAVNLAGAGTISSVTNALGGELKLFVFGGDGAQFATAPEHKSAAASALDGVRSWAKHGLGLNLRVAMVQVGEVRAAGFDVCVAFWQASRNVRYAMFIGGGLEWAESQMKSGGIFLPLTAVTQEPNFTGLSCQWGTVKSRNGSVVSLIVKRGPEASDVSFAEATSEVIALLDDSISANPIPDKGPDVSWPSASLRLQSYVGRSAVPLWWRRIQVVCTAAIIWTIFRLGITIGQFVPDDYRRELAANTDFRKFNDGLLMTIDCTFETIERLQQALDAATAKGIIRYGIHTQSEALITCVAPSVLNSSHMHFVDGAGGGYASAAKQLVG